MALARLDKRGDDPDLRQSAPLPQVIAALQDGALAAIEVLERACKAYADRPALGERELRPDGTPAATFRTLRFGTVWQRTAALAAGLVRDPRTALRTGEAVGIYGFGSIDYVLADMACLYAGLPSAVLQMGMPVEDLRHVVNEAGLACLIGSAEGLPDLLEVLSACPSVRSLVVMDDPGTRSGGPARDGGGRPVLALDELVTAGRAAPLGPRVPGQDEDPLATLMYTSGSTGFPKGAMLTQRVWRSHWQLHALHEFERFPNISINFYPLSHAMGRNALLRTLVLGGATHFTLRSDLSTLFEDIRLVRPTFLNLVPRLSEMIHQAYLAEVRRLARAGRFPTAAEAEARESMGAAFLGDRLTAVFIGSAPTAPEIAAFLADCFRVPVYEGFGSTEAGVLTIDGAVCRPIVSAYKLAGVPELGYRLDDRPHPRGELRVMTGQTIPGYFRNPEATAALYDEEGFLRTGDIVEELGPDQLRWIDRINNVVKLAQGEYVTLWRLEATFSAGSPLMDQVYLYANSQRAYPLAVVVPAWAAVRERLEREGSPTGTAEVRALLRSEFSRIAVEARLRPYEVPRDFLVEADRWTRANGFLTGINKPARPQLKRRYGDALEARYGRLALPAGEPDGGQGDAPASEQVRRAAQAILGLESLDLAVGSFRALGGDSLGALELSVRLEEACGVPVPAAAILNPGASLQALADGIEARRRPGALPTFQRIHGRAAAMIRSGDLRLEPFLGEAVLAGAAAVAAQPLPAQVRTVLLTGASGFLGHVLCLEWLEQMAKVGGKVIALVRAPGDAAAAGRLAAAFQTGDLDLPRHFARLAEKHLDVVAGDLAAPALGLPEATYRRLADEVDLIVHPGALVNHVLDYEQLFEPNVLGSAQLMALALRGRRKRFDFVSTLGVLEGAGAPGPVDEREGVAALGSAWPAQGGYAHGYATSKWAGEVLLNGLHARFRTPVRVFRPSMIMPHRRYLGQANGPDLLTRLLRDVVRTGLAPRSFHAAPHFDGLPVDFVAAAMVALSSAGGDGLETYQVSNTHWNDGVSLDTLMDWVEAAGHPLQRMDDYGAWYQTFGDRLRALPTAERQGSSLPILHLWANPDSGRGRTGASRFREAVRRLKPGGAAEPPHLGPAYLGKYLRDLEALGLLTH